MVKAILLSVLVMLGTFIRKIGGVRKLFITFYPFAFKQSGKLHVVSHKMLPSYKMYPQISEVDLPQKQLEKIAYFFFRIERLPCLLQVHQTVWTKLG